MPLGEIFFYFILNEMATVSISQTVGVLTPAMFIPGTQPL